MECPNGSYLAQFLHKYVHMFSCPAILSSYIFLVSFFFCSKDVYARAFLCRCSYDPGLICAALFLLISLTDSGTQSVNNKDRRQKLPITKLIYYKYSINIIA